MISFVIKGWIDFIGDGSGYGAKGKIIHHKELEVVFPDNNVVGTIQIRTYFSIVSITVLGSTVVILTSKT